MTTVLTSKSVGQRPASKTLVTGAHILLVVAIAWGAFAFGAVYSWAYWPLASGVAAIAAAGYACGRTQLSLHLKPLTLAMTLFAAAVVVQLVPLPSGWLRTLSPRALSLLASLELASVQYPDRHTTSIAPDLTTTALLLFASFSLLVVGSAHLFTIRGPRAVARAITVIGVLLAMAAIIQKPLSTEKIYGLWMPEVGREPFGPFVNKNHFAGWMMMALPITLGLLCGGVARGIRGARPTLRDRLVWLSSPDASRLILLAGAAALMALSLALTLSRSGVAAMLFALAITAVVALKRQGSAAGRTVMAGYLVLIAVAVTAWVGIDTIIGRFTAADWSNFGDRWGPWSDAAGVAALFPLTGTGLNTYSVAMIFYQHHDLAHHYSAAHNDYLQLAAEGGLLLTVPAILCAAAFITLVWKRFAQDTSTSGYWLRVGAITGLCAIALQEMVDFSLQMPGNVVLFAVLCGICLHRSPERASP